MNAPGKLWVLQIATPFSSGTGFYLAGEGLVLTNEHLVRDNSTVIVRRPDGERELMPVIYLDAHHDLAFLRPETPWPEGTSNWAKSSLEVNQAVKAVGRWFNDREHQSDGNILSTDFEYQGIQYYLHDAWLDATHSGGPLISEAGELLGLNVFDSIDGRPRALCLPATTLQNCLEEFNSQEGRSATRCFHCQTLNFEMGVDSQSHCVSCGKSIQLPGMVPDYQADGIQATVEEIIQAAGYDPRLARQGPNLWEINQGSARILVSYHEDSGLVTGDAHLCNLPESHPPDLFEFLLEQNYELEQLTFSTWGRDIILSLLIYDRYLSIETALPRFEHLFERADYYDNVLVDRFGAEWSK